MPSFLASINESVDTTRNIVVFALIMARIMAIVVLVPWLGGKSAPMEVKMGVGASLAMVLWPTVLSSMTADIPLHPISFVMLMLKEAFVGMVIGYVSAEIFYTVEMAGEVIDVLRGANQIQLQVPELNERSSAFGNLQYQLLLALFLGLEQHRIFIEALFESFVKIPLNEFPTMGGDFLSFLDTMAYLVSHIFAVAITLTVPVAIVALVVETSFGLLNRVAPQINAYFMAMPAKVIAGVIIYFFAFSMILEQMLEHAHIMLGNVQRIIDMMI